MDINTTVTFLTSKESTSVVNSITAISFMITIYVAFSLSNIRKFFKYKVRIPQITDDLHQLISDLSNHLDTFSGINSTIQKTLAEIDVKLDSLNNIIDKSIKKKWKEIQKLMKDIEPKKGWFSPQKKYSKKDYTDKLTQIHIALHKLKSQIMEKSEDSKWEQQ